MSAYWDQVYATKGVDERSWSQDEPTTSLDLFEALGVTAAASVIDIGAGEAPLVDYLVARGYSDVSLLDISATALEVVTTRLGEERVRSVCADITTWDPARPYDVWHDRAVLHFLSDADAARYARTLRAALAPGGAVVIGVFAPDGPTTCSGLPVTRYSGDDLASLLGDEFSVIEQRREDHPTPWGAVQPFQWIAARRRGGA